MVSILHEALERKVVKPWQKKSKVMQSKISKEIWTSSTWIHHIRSIRMKGGRGGAGRGGAGRGGSRGCTVSHIGNSWSHRTTVNRKRMSFRRSRVQKFDLQNRQRLFRWCRRNWPARCEHLTSIVCILVRQRRGCMDAWLFTYRMPHALTSALFNAVTYSDSE